VSFFKDIEKKMIEDINRYSVSNLPIMAAGLTVILN
jgi:hypothetical protein